MAYWLVKSEPDCYSWQKMQQDGVTHWDGVRNYQARNNLKAMAIGDIAFFYHSNKEKAIKGTVEVVKTYYPDHTDELGKFGMVDVKFKESFANSIPLSFIKQHDDLQTMALVKQSRLSVMPVSPENFRLISALGMSGAS